VYASPKLFSQQLAVQPSFWGVTCALLPLLLTFSAPTPASLHRQCSSALARTHCLLTGVLSSWVLWNLVIIMLAFKKS